MGGQQAYINGRDFEVKVFNVLNKLATVNIIRNIPYPSIYSAFGKPPVNHHTVMEFRAQNLKLTYKTLDSKGSEITKTRTFDDVNIECKYQEQAGSIDEKYPLVYQNSLISDADTTLFVYENPEDKIKEGALNYIRHVARNSKEKLIVLEFKDFISSIEQDYLLLLSEDNIIENIDRSKSLFSRLESDSRRKFINASHCDDFTKRYKSYLNLQINLFNDYLYQGIRKAETHGVIGDMKGERRRLLELIKECNPDMFDE